ncbi:hypothetical protein GCM10011391_28040 [Pullulanibacillus camelliae]|uniref:Minor capsid protein n=1 Tax=Pullulanibacillus camelliae TaxID=1707096 RepID=A0A8J3DX33_9BACL|nr:minor capsid protein [Pullulanibacillus camelliae]GGE47647.1 hypothetical protein GCM10011391_28040 [Pullulanibacillus camelliae]
MNTKRIAPKIHKATGFALPILTQQVVKDSNFYIPYDTGEMMMSSLRASDFNNGKAVWDTPYAKKMYYGINFNFSHDINPHAQAMWPKKAESAHKKEWSQVAKKAVDKGL